MSKLAKQILSEAMKEAGEAIEENIRSIKPNPEYGPMIASGRALNSIKVMLTSDGAKLVSSMPDKEFNYIRTLETGRRGKAQDNSMKWPPRDAIKDWMKTKGITPNDPKTTEDQLAFLIQRKIGQEGTWLARNGAQSGILSTVINEKYIRENINEPLIKALSAKLRRLIFAA